VGPAFQAFIGKALGQTYTGVVFNPYTHDQLLLIAAFILEDVAVTAYQVQFINPGKWTNRLDVPSEEPLYVRIVDVRSRVSRFMRSAQIKGYLPAWPHGATAICTVG